MVRQQIMRTLSLWQHFDNWQLNRLRYMSHEAKNIYNTTLFHTKIFNRYRESIYCILYHMFIDGAIEDPDQLDDHLYCLYNSYYQHYLSIKDLLQHNNNIIYQSIRNAELMIVNSNFNNWLSDLTKFFKKCPILQYPQGCDEPTRKELCDDIVFYILKYMYNKNFLMIKREIMNHKKCTIQDKVFIEQVKNDEHLFDNQ